MTTPALCQCVRCLRYLTRNRKPEIPESHEHQCAECYPGNGGLAFRPRGIPLAKIRGTLTDPLKRECLDLLSEEAAEVIQRVSKIGRWGWDADFEGTTQTHKLEVELGDQIAVLALAAENGLVSIERVLENARAKLSKFREDAAGPRQRLLHARVPDALTWCTTRDSDDS